MAKKKPLPKDVQELINTYTTSKNRLLAIIQQKQRRGSVVRYQKQLVTQIEREIQRLNEQSTTWVNKTIPKNYNKGVMDAIEGLAIQGIVETDPKQFTKIHTRAVNILVQNATNDLTNANTFVGRQINDVIRKVTIDEITQKTATGATIQATQKRIANELINRGLAGVQTKGGRTLQIDKYAEIVARSTTREATNTALLKQLESSGHDLVKMSSHGSSCPVCGKLEGRVYSISGTDPDFPPLTKAHSGVHANIHPNCRHVLMPYIKEYARDYESDKKFSNRSFDLDNRTQNSIKLYNQQQKTNYEMNRDKRQWDRYRTLMPDGTPKTFSAFRRMKNANSEKYQELRRSYREVRNAT